MGFSFGLGLNTMVHELQQDAGSFKLSEMANNINSTYAALGQNASTYVDFTQSHLNYKENLEQRVDDNVTFMFEFQALLQSKIQEMVNKLTASLTNDLEYAMSVNRAGVVTWDNAGNSRSSMQGYTTNTFQDAGAARTSYNFFLGYAANGTVQAAGSAGSNANTTPYMGQNVAALPGRPIVSEDTPADADFGFVRSVGTAAIQQGIIDTDDPGIAAIGGVPILDSLQIGLAAFAGTPTDTQQTIAGAAVAHNADTGYHQALDRHRYDIEFTNAEAVENNNTAKFGKTDVYYDTVAQAKNRFEATLATLIGELENRGWLRDAMTLSKELGLFENVQVASSSTTPTGSQVQAEVVLDFVPANANRPDLGGSIDIVFDKWTAFYHS